MLTAAWLFGIFLVIAFVFRRLDASQETLGGRRPASRPTCSWPRPCSSSGAAGAGAAATPGATAKRFVGAPPGVIAAVGEPVEVGEPEGEIPTGSGAAQANLAVPVYGPDDEGRVDLVMARHRAPLGGAVGDAGRRRRPGAARRGARGGPPGTTTSGGGAVADSSMGLHEAREDLSPGDARAAPGARLAHGGARGDGLVPAAHRRHRRRRAAARCSRTTATRRPSTPR